jgi:hypothetical protein
MARRREGTREGKKAQGKKAQGKKAQGKKAFCVSCAVLSAWVSLGASAKQGEARDAKPDEIVTLVVPATSPWTDTGIRLRKGDTVRIRGWGRVEFDADAKASIGPGGSGRPAGGCRFVVTNAKAPAQSLVGNVAPGIGFEGGGFFVGAAWKGTVPIAGATAPEGHLLLGFNDDGMECDRSGYDSWDFGGDNSGWFSAEVAITRAR